MMHNRSVDWQSILRTTTVYLLRLLDTPMVRMRSGECTELLMGERAGKKFYIRMKILVQSRLQSIQKIRTSYTLISGPADKAPGKTEHGMDLKVGYSNQLT